ncbi:hypothetical protein [Rubrimonas cliftonensis]|uniref:Sulfotransferase family protein n=1 Tax=Rubrimonas cliftonensis TaxID=89524 RepID=A0A1H4CV98_9RHOB|nr:hypothetical protein [Rubrimonas cliftonensis]SEA64032.1 hypothetical protein SAMN05444370_10842 [Rubrimonas cliftonensis]
MQPVRDWRMHLGVHKTATTHVQDLLEHNRMRLLERGVDYLPMEVNRLNQLPDLRMRHWRLWAAGAPMRRHIHAALAPLRAGPQTVVVSEENWLGPSPDALASPIYPRAWLRMRAFASLEGDGARLEVFLSLRYWETMLPSVYVQILRERVVPGGFDTVREAVRTRPPSWAAHLKRLRRAAPAVKIRVWRYEDYRSAQGHILSALCGVDVSDLEDVTPPVRTRAPHADAVPAAERLDASLPPRERNARVAELFNAPSPPGAEPFAPFDTTERKRLRALYARDIDAIAQLDGVELLRFDY